MIKYEVVNSNEWKVCESINMLQLIKKFFKVILYARYPACVFDMTYRSWHNSECDGEANVLAKFKCIKFKQCSKKLLVDGVS